jgi:hypothetical protein
MDPQINSKVQRECLALGFMIALTMWTFKNSLAIVLQVSSKEKRELP